MSEPLAVAACAALSGADDSEGISQWGCTERPWLPEQIARAVRSHWEVDSRLHWCLGARFVDDYACARIGHFALNLIRLCTSIKAKRPVAATSNDFRAGLLGFEVPGRDEGE